MVGAGRYVAGVGAPTSAYLWGVGLQPEKKPSLIGRPRPWLPLTASVSAR